METLYEMTKRLGKGQGEGMMWDTVKIVSDAVEESMSAKDKEALYAKLFGMLSGGHFDEDHATNEVAKMYYIDKDGAKRYAPFWTIPELEEVYESVKDQIPSEYNEWDFYVTMQMMMAKYRILIEKWWPGISAEDLAEKVSDLSVNYLADKDGIHGTRKIWCELHPSK